MLALVEEYLRNNPPGSSPEGFDSAISLLRDLLQKQGLEQHGDEWKEYVELLLGYEFDSIDVSEWNIEELADYEKYINGEFDYLDRGKAHEKKMELLDRIHKRMNEEFKRELAEAELTQNRQKAVGIGKGQLEVSGV